MWVERKTNDNAVDSQNAKIYPGTLRHPIEQVFGGLGHDKGVKKLLDAKYFVLFPDDDETFHGLSKAQVLFHLSVDFYNRFVDILYLIQTKWFHNGSYFRFHARFGLNFTSEENLLKMENQIFFKLNRGEFINHVDILGWSGKSS